jgi:cystathionine gamma-lyase/cystathionine beta-lyase
MQRHCENGEKIAHYLRNHSEVGKVYWCGLKITRAIALRKNK